MAGNTTGISDAGTRNARHRGELTARERARVDKLAGLDDDAFAQAVFEYMARFEEQDRLGDRRIFRADQLAARTHEMLSRIRKPVVEQINQIGRPVDYQQKRRRARLEQLAGRMKKEREVLAALLNASAPGEGLRLSAAFVVADALHRDELTLAVKLLTEDKLSQPEAVEAMRAIVVDGVDRAAAVASARKAKRERQPQRG